MPVQLPEQLFCLLQREDVLVINRARLLRDTYFTDTLNAMKHKTYLPLSTKG